MKTADYHNIISFVRKVFLLTLLLGGSLLLRSQSIAITMDTVTALPGDSVTVPVYAHNFTNVGSFTFFIQYNTNVLNFGRVLNWNENLLSGVHLGNAAAGQVAVVWADVDGVNFGEGKLFDIKFKYNSANSYLNFTNQCEITDISGSPIAEIQYSSGYITRRISVVMQASPPAVCYGDTSQLSFVVQGGLGAYTYSWSSDPAGFSDTLENPKVNPAYSTTYQIMVTDGFDTAYSTFLLTVYFFISPSPVENMTPVDGTTNLTLPVLLTWSPSANASSYDLYLWKVGDEEPLTPVISNINQISYLLSTFLEYGKSYHWKITAKNPCLSTPGPIQTFTVRDLPDLIVNTINTPPQVYSGQTINVDFQVLNIGLGSTMTAQWNDNVYLSTDTTLEPDIDYYVGAYQNLTYLGPQEAYNHTITFTLPQGISGYYYIIVKTDYNNNVLETNNNNNVKHNTDTMLVYLSPVPDLRVAKIIVQNSAFSGQPVNITWHVKNFGLANTGNLTWNDRVYFSQDTVLNSSAVNLGTFIRSGDLPVDSLYEMTRTISIPDYILGRFYFYVVADVYNQVYEHALENNNSLRSDSITIFLTPPPDLVTTSVIAPLTASNNEIVTIQWTVQNQGINPATDVWFDKVYLTNSMTLNTSTAFMLESKRHSGVLAPDSSYSVSLSVKIPGMITGPYYFFVFADATLRVFEHNQEENNIKRCGNPTEILPSDLVSKQVTSLDTGWSGQPCPFSYYSADQGQGKLIGSWTDKIFISSSPVFNLNSATLLSTRVYNNETILSNDSVLRSFPITLPNGISGQYYLFVVCDYFNTLLEPSHEDNNVSVVPITVMLTPWPDLVVTGISFSDDTVTPGFPFNLTYTIKNVGPGSATGHYWYEKFYLSLSYNSLHPIYHTITIKDSLTLLPDSSFTKTVQVTIPPNVPSNDYFWWLMADADDNIYEHTGESNNWLTSLQQFVEPYPPVDLVTYNVNNPSNAMSGASIMVTWSAVNNGIVPSLGNHWWEYVFLSADTTPNPSTDIMLNYFLYNKGILYPGSSYTNGESVTLPNGISGDYYLYVYVDYFNLNHDAKPADNIGMMRNVDGFPIPIHIAMTPPPDLTVITYSCPPVGITGQPLTVSWTVQNQGVGPTAGNLWYDIIYLSTDFIVDNSDYILGSYQHTGLLLPDSSYSITETFYIPNWAVGNYIIIVKTDATNSVYEHTNETNNTSSQVIDLQVPPPSDLIVSQIIPPTEALSGDNVSITWTLKNIGVNPATGYMKDLIYFSEDTIWDISDITFGSVTDYISIGPNAEFNRSFSGIISELTPGSWYIIVRTDVLNNIIEGNDNNNTTYSVQKITITIPELPLNTWISKTLSDYVPVYYRIEIPASLAGETMQIRLLGDSTAGSNEMYLRLGSLPTRTTYDYSYDIPNYGNQEILIPFLTEGTYYLMVYGSTADGNIQSVELHARILNFQIISVSDNKGGNNGLVTLKMIGSKFTSNMIVYLVKGENKIVGTNLQFIDASKVYITFNLLDAEIGQYDVVATKLCEGLAVLEHGFTVLAGSAPSLEVNMFYPSSMRPNGIATITIEFTNNGTVDLIAPAGLLSSLGGAPLSYTISGLSAGITSLEIPFREAEGPPNILRPGMSGTVIIYSKASSGMAFTLQLTNY